MIPGNEYCIVISRTLEIGPILKIISVLCVYFLAVTATRKQTRLYFAEIVLAIKPHAPGNKLQCYGVPFKSATKISIAYEIFRLYRNEMELGTGWSGKGIKRIKRHVKFSLHVNMQSGR